MGRGWTQKGPGPRGRRPQEDSPRAEIQDEGPVAGLGWVEQGFVEELKGEAGFLKGSRSRSGILRAKKGSDGRSEHQQSPWPQGTPLSG